jgi:hypothetical protein
MRRCGALKRNTWDVGRTVGFLIDEEGYVVMEDMKKSKEYGKWLGPA